MPSERTEEPIAEEESEQQHPAQEISATIAEETDCDVLLLNARIFRPLDNKIIDLCRNRKRRKNVLFILVTEGGDADACYRIAKCLQESYESFTCVVGGYCKSAGTLMALGANELVMSDYGELGPLDVQMSKEDELGAVRSGLTIHSALDTLHTAAYKAFEYFFLETKRRSQGGITTVTAIKVATDLSGKLFSPIYSHVDAMHIGEADRMLKIAHKYGEILDSQSCNLKEKTLNKLTTDYPSHGFVIDRHQAEELFVKVRRPNQNEERLLLLLGQVAVNPSLPPSTPQIAFLNPEVPEQNVSAHQGDSNDNPISPQDSPHPDGQEAGETRQSPPATEAPRSRRRNVVRTPTAS
jgi:hypothetical protein